MTSSVVGPRRSSKVRPKAKLAPKKVMVTVLWSAASLIHYSFLNPSKTITSEMYAQQINERHWKRQPLQLALVNRKGPILLHDSTPPHVIQPMLKKLNELGYKVLPHLSLFIWPLANQLPLLQASQQLFFAGKTLPAGGRKCFPRVHWILKHGFLCYRNKLISHWQKCVDYNGSYFD